MKQLVASANATTGGINNMEGADGVDYDLSPVRKGRRRKRFRTEVDPEASYVQDTVEAYGRSSDVRREDEVQGSDHERECRVARPRVAFALCSRSNGKDLVSSRPQGIDGDRESSPILTLGARGHTGLEDGLLQGRDLRQHDRNPSFKSCAKVSVPKAAIVKPKSRFGARAQIRR
jgi:hypothetical protein